MKGVPVPVAGVPVGADQLYDPVPPVAVKTAEAPLLTVWVAGAHASVTGVAVGVGAGVAVGVGSGVPAIQRVVP